MKKLLIALAALALTTLSETAEAQRIGDRRAGVALPEQPSNLVPAARDAVAPRPPVASMAATGALFAAGGILGGAVVGMRMACPDQGSDDWCELGGALLGATVGEALMLPLGVHLASSRTGYGKKLLVSSGVLLAGLALAPVTSGVSLLLTPPAQLVTTIAVESRAIRAR